MNFPIIPQIPQMGIWGIFNLSGINLFDRPAHAGLNRIGWIFRSILTPNSGHIDPQKN